MSVLVKGISMPECCDECVLCDVKWTSDDDGEAWAFCMPKQKMLWHTTNGSDKEVSTEILKKPSWCPLVEVLTPHGKLIDADELKKDLTRFYDNEVTAKQLIDEQRAVIEEEE